MSVDLIASVLGAAKKPNAQLVAQKPVAQDSGNGNFFTRLIDTVRKPDKSANIKMPTDDLIAQVMAAAPEQKVAAATDRLMDIGGAAVAEGQNKAATDLEGALLTALVEEMMPKDTGGLYGNGTAGEVWRGFHVQQLAEAAAQDGVLGLQAMMAPDQPKGGNGALVRSPQWPYFMHREITPFAG